MIILRKKIVVTAADCHSKRYRTTNDKMVLLGWMHIWSLKTEKTCLCLEAGLKHKLNLSYSSGTKALLDKVKNPVHHEVFKRSGGVLG